jgi:hypothetical protein
VISERQVPTITALRTDNPPPRRPRAAGENPVPSGADQGEIVMKNMLLTRLPLLVTLASLAVAGGTSRGW